jgi:hypothetical protein
MLRIEIQETEKTILFQVYSNTRRLGIQQLDKTRYPHAMSDIIEELGKVVDSMPDGATCG